MKRTRLLCIGKTKQDFVSKGLQLYEERLRKFTHYESVFLKETKVRNVSDLKKKEAELIGSALSDGEALVLLDEKGKQYGSVLFAEQLGNWMESYQSIAFVIGGAYGFHDELRKRAHAIISLSKMTFPHDLVRIVFLEQLYRAHTIMNNQKYHHE